MKKTWVIRILLFSLLLILILDSKNIAAAVCDGITLCTQSVIPSLFPFIVLSPVLNTHIVGISFPGSKIYSSLTGAPSGSAPMFILGLLAGYPTGAKYVGDSYSDGRLTTKQAQSLLAFCNNCGPAFLFGICSHLFTRRIAPWLLWVIELISALLVGTVLRHNDSIDSVFVPKKSTSSTIVEVVQSGMKTMAVVCAWVIIFRVIISILSKRICYLLPEWVSIVLFGLLELTNGCVLLNNIGSEFIRFVLCCLFITFGGICVAMQTGSVCGNLRIKYYIKGKVLQTVLAINLALWTGYFLYRPRLSIGFLLLITTIITVLSICIKKHHKSTGLYEKSVV